MTWIDLTRCSKVVVDVRSNLGKNLALVREASGGLDPWVASAGQLQAALQRSERREVPEADFWRVGLLQKLLAERLQANYAADAALLLSPLNIRSNRWHLNRA